MKTKYKELDHMSTVVTINKKSEYDFINSWAGENGRSPLMLNDIKYPVFVGTGDGLTWTNYSDRALYYMPFDEFLRKIGYELNNQMEEKRLIITDLNYVKSLLLSEHLIGIFNMVEDFRTMRQDSDNLGTRCGKGKVKKHKIKGNIWFYDAGNKSTTDKIAFMHPAIFPEKLAEDHIISWSNENDVVLDPMCGSGTTCKMAKLNKRNYIGIDASKEYCEISESRISHQNNNHKRIHEENNRKNKTTSSRKTKHNAR